MEVSSEANIRAARKDEHIRYFLESCSDIHDNGFEDVIIHNNSLPQIDFDSVQTHCKFMGKRIAFPMMINAMTGGTEYTGEINRQLADLAVKYGLPIAVGSQTIAISDPGVSGTFRVVRDINKTGIVIANVSANSSMDKAAKAIEMLDADALQLHLNTAQEISMPEGDRSFKGILENIEKLAKGIGKPVIVKEVGFGISFETAKRLGSVGVSYIDIGGRGGTNFVEIENRRRKIQPNVDRDFSFLYEWGIPTALSLLECRNASRALNIICSGGMRKADEVIKALCMGADITAISGVLLRELLINGYEAADKLLDRLIFEAKVIMLLLGAENLEQLKKVPYLLKGTVKELYEFKFA